MGWVCYIERVFLRVEGAFLFRDTKQDPFDSVLMHFAQGDTIYYMSDYMTSDWQHSLKNMITDPAELLARLQLDSRLLSPAIGASRDFKLRVTEEFVARIKPADINDPLLRQILPISEENLEVPGFLLDPLQESDLNPVKGLLHKYQGRVLLTVAGACAINCRYCFRRHFPYQDNNPGRRGWAEVLDYIRNDASISEVIYSGGDPLLMTDDLLEELTDQIATIRHVQTLRIHTRLPIVIPERINHEFLAWFTKTRLQPVMVIHCNHAQEVDEPVVRAMTRLRNAGVMIFNQAVLLKGVNDSAETLVDLSRTLFKSGVVPYYLHLLDKVKGSAHFNVTEELAKKLMMDVRKQLPGYLVPRLVREVPGSTGKTPIDI